MNTRPADPQDPESLTVRSPLCLGLIYVPPDQRCSGRFVGKRKLPQNHPSRSAGIGTILLELPQPLTGLVQVLVLFCKAEAQQIFAAAGAEEG